MEEGVIKNLYMKFCLIFFLFCFFIAKRLCEFLFLKEFKNKYTQ